MIEGVDVWYVAPALITGIYYWLEFLGCLPHQRRGRRTVTPIFERSLPLLPDKFTVGDLAPWKGVTLRNERADVRQDRLAMRTQRDVLRALFEEQLRAAAYRMTPVEMGPVGVERRMCILGQMLGNNGVELQPLGNTLLVRMGTRAVQIPTPPVGYLIPQVADAINRLMMAKQTVEGRPPGIGVLDAVAGAVGGGAGVIGGMFGGGRGETPSHFGGGWAPGKGFGDLRVPRPPLLTKEPPWSNP